MAQNLAAQTDDKLIAIANLIGDAPSAKFPFDTALKDAAKAKALSVAASDADLASQEKAYRLAREYQRRDRAALLATLASAAKLAEASTAVTDADLISVGLQPRAAKGNRPRVPLTPTDLAAQAQGDGSVRASWKAASGKMAYLVETSPDGTAWSALPPCSRQSVVVENLPGVALWVRVRASNAGMLSAPTAPVSAYAPVAALRIEQGGLARAA